MAPSSGLESEKGCGRGHEQALDIPKHGGLPPLSKLIFFSQPLPSARLS